MCRVSTLLMLLLASPVMAQSWVGKDVMAIKWNVELREDSRIVGKLELGTILNVEKEDGDSLWVHRGWVQRSDVKPIAEALTYLTKQVESNPSHDAYFNRAAALRLFGEIDKALADAHEAVRLRGRPRDYNLRGGLLVFKTGRRQGYCRL